MIISSNKPNNSHKTGANKAWREGHAYAYMAGVATSTALIAMQSKPFAKAATLCYFSSLVAVGSGATEETPVTTEEAPEESGEYFNSSLGELTDTELFGANPTFNEEV
jgi:hypothetical protein